MIRRAPTKHKIALSGWWDECGAAWYCFQCGRTWRGAVVGPCVGATDVPLADGLDRDGGGALVEVGSGRKVTP